MANQVRAHRPRRTGNLGPLGESERPAATSGPASPLATRSERLSRRKLSRRSLRECHDLRAGDGAHAADRCRHQRLGCPSGGERHAAIELRPGRDGCTDVVIRAAREGTGWTWTLAWLEIVVPRPRAAT